HHESSAFGVGLRYKKRCPLQTRAAKLPKEKPAVRDLLTAGVVRSLIRGKRDKKIEYPYGYPKWVCATK
ncbi:hypothetical protein NIF40_09445, partial [[Clostridium] leptum]|nr:hypothetical protein [[Clostridium] leptum]